MKSPYSRHPAADFIFYSAAVLMTLMFQHPLFLAINFISSLIYAAMLREKKAAKIFIFACIPVFLLILAATTAFSHYGITTLAILESGNRITLEAIVNGAVIGTKTVTFILWFSCFSAVVTEEKYLHALGKLSPRLAVAAMLILRFIPFYAKQFTAAFEIHKGAKNKPAAFFSSVGSTFRLAAEKCFETADSMRARGYGLKGRTSYSRFYIAKSDVAAAITASVSAAAAILLHSVSPAKALYNPMIIIGKPSVYETAAALFYAVFCLMPSVLYYLFMIKSEVITVKRISAVILCAILIFCPSCSSENAPEITTGLNTTAVETTVSESVTENTSTEASTKAVTQAPTETRSEPSAEAVQTVPSTAAPTEPQAPKTVCTISICCTQALKNSGSLKSGKEYFLPSSGYILSETQVEFTEGETVFDVFKRVCQTQACTDNCEYCKQGGIHYEASYNPGFENYYIEGIHQIYEKDCGPFSGWMYKVNGEFPNYGCSSYYLKNGDKIEFIYTCDLGSDIGASFS